MQSNIVPRITVLPCSVGIVSPSPCVHCDETLDSKGAPGGVGVQYYLPMFQNKIYDIFMNQGYPST